MLIELQPSGREEWLFFFYLRSLSTLHVCMCTHHNRNTNTLDPHLISAAIHVGYFDKSRKWVRKSMI